MLLALSAAFLAAAGADLIVPTARLDALANALVVDARPADAYAAGHIPGAVHLDVAALSETRDGVAGMLKPIDAVRPMFGAAGIDPAKHVVVYSAMDKPGDLATAARLFWILDYVGYPKVSVLDGGFAKWTAEGRTTETGAPLPKAVVLPEMTVRASRLATAATVSQIVEKRNAVLVDARAPDYYTGAKKTDVVKGAGHIPGAVNLFVDTCVGGDGAVKLPEELRAIAASSGVDASSPVVTYCNTGRSASTAYLLLRLLGHENVAVYDGSMAEWTAAGARPVQKQETK